MRKNRNNHQNLTIQGMIKIKNTSIRISYKTQYTAEVAFFRDILYRGKKIYAGEKIQGERENFPITIRKYR